MRFHIQLFPSSFSIPFYKCKQSLSFFFYFPFLMFCLSLSFYFMLFTFSYTLTVSFLHFSIDFSHSCIPNISLLHFPSKLPLHTHKQTLSSFSLIYFFIPTNSFLLFPFNCLPFHAHTLPSRFSISTREFNKHHKLGSRRRSLTRLGYESLYRQRYIMIRKFFLASLRKFPLLPPWRGLG